MQTIQLIIEAGEPEQELLISQLLDLDATGFEQTDTHLLAYFDALHFRADDVAQLLGDYPYTVSELEAQNWNAVWESNFQPVRVGEFCGIRAEFHPPFDRVAHEVVITPKMSFGTGHHATTYMMVAHMQDLDFKNKTVFDFGTGTGILAILAEKLGAASVYAIDVDDWSIENTRENAVRNACRHIEVKQTAQLPEQAFDLVLANINRNVILEYLPKLAGVVKPTGQILFSGLLVQDKEDIVKAATAQGFALRKDGEKDNWISLLFVK